MPGWMMFRHLEWRLEGHGTQSLWPQATGDQAGWQNRDPKAQIAMTTVAPLRGRWASFLNPWGIPSGLTAWQTCRGRLFYREVRQQENVLPPGGAGGSNPFQNYRQEKIKIGVPGPPILKRPIRRFVSILCSSLPPYSSFNGVCRHHLAGVKSILLA